jgi:hypothetical protein
MSTNEPSEPTDSAEVYDWAARLIDEAQLKSGAEHPAEAITFLLGLLVSHLSSHVSERDMVQTLALMLSQVPDLYEEQDIAETLATFNPPLPAIEQGPPVEPNPS